MNTSQILIQLLNGISYGALLFLLASGLSLIFGLMRVVNLAHGSYYLTGAYLGIETIKFTGSFILGTAVAGLSVAVLGAVMERLFIQKLYKKELEQVLLTFGFSYIFMDLCKWLWGGTPMSLPKPLAYEGSIRIMEEEFPIYRLFIIAMGLAITLLLWIFIEKSRMGAIIRAGVDDREMVSGLGINIRLYFTFVFAIGAFLAAVGGVAGGPVVGAYPGCDSEILVLALAIVVIGGMGTLKGAFAGSMLIGFADTFGKVFFPELAIVSIYIAMALVLIFKPNGLLGRE